MRKRERVKFVLIEGWVYNVDSILFVKPAAKEDSTPPGKWKSVLVLTNGERQRTELTPEDLFDKLLWQVEA